MRSPVLQRSSTRIPCDSSGTAPTRRKYCCRVTGSMSWQTCGRGYLPKGCLADYLSDASCRLEWTTRYQIIKGICEGVHYLHDQRIIHMDLNPQNVLLDDSMVPRIADFGLSRRLSEIQSRAISKNKIGTIGYMAPEFINNGEITFKNDIYSLGAIIVEILMGCKERSSVTEVVESWMNKFGTSKSQTTLEQVKLCAKIGIKCTNHDPGNRPPTRFIIREILGEAELSNCFVTSDLATSIEGQISFTAKLTDELKLMDDSTAPSKQQPSMLEVEQEDGKVSQERKASAVSVTTGVMKTVHGKLTTLMDEEYNKRKEVRKQAYFLEKELSSINASLEQLELMDELAPGVKNWRDDVREISYDMENCIDDFMRQFGGEDAEAGFIGEAAELHKRLCDLHQIANQMEELGTLAKEANARRDSYKIDYCMPSSGTVAVDPRLPAMYQEATNLVGIDGPREEVANWLTGTKKKLKLVSVVGFGGVGKTTLAKQVYDKISGKFNCVAFISVSQRPDMRVLLNSLQWKLRIKKSSHDHGIDNIIEEIRKYLTNKRYLIVVDDLWDQSTWNTISCAFPKNANGSRILVTTRMEDVASMICHSDRECIYTMRPLNEENSKMLFSNRVFGSEVVCPPYVKDVADEILKKCGGLPLAIITIASLLATQVRSRKHWESIRKSLGAQSATNTSLKEMNGILNLSYTHLPLHLRPCFLYLGMYSEDHIILRDDLVKQWIGEGFVSSLHGPDLEAVGRSYFNELVNRSMIQPAKTEYGEVLSCRVHDMMLDLILSKCVEDNFLSVAYNSDDMARLLHLCKYKVHRLSLSSMAVGGATYDTAIAARLSQVRSLLFNMSMLPLLWFKYLRVLIIYNGLEIVDLTAASQLFQLRCLIVSCRKIMLPTKLGELVYLETLDIWIESTHLPEGIRNMKSLRTLRGLDMEKSSLECFIGLSELTNPRELDMSAGPSLGLPKVDALALSIGKLCNLETLVISGGNHAEREDNQQLGSLSNPFQHIERLGLPSWRLPMLPRPVG